MKRRRALQLIAALSAGMTIPPGFLEEVLAGVTPTPDDRTDLDEWERVVHEYGCLLETRPTGALIPDLIADIIAVGALMGGQNSSQGQSRLLRISAGLCGLLAVELGDKGDQRAARVSWNAAQRAADASGDRDLRVWVRGRAAQDAFWAGRPHDVVTQLTDEAIDIAGGTPSAGLARAHIARAYLASRQDDDAGASSSVKTAEHVYGQLDHQVARLSALGFAESHLRWGAAYVYTRTGDDQAEAALEQAQALFPSGAVSQVANLSLMRARRLIATREIGEGLGHALTALQERSGTMSARARLLVGEVVGALPDEARALPAARELHALTAGA